MKRGVGFILAVLLAFSVVGCSGSGAPNGQAETGKEEPVIETPFEGHALVWDDPEVEDAVRAALNKPEGEILGEEAAAVKSILLPERDIWDLRDFKYLVGLEELDVSGNHLRDLSGIEGLSKLRVLNISGNQLRDLSGLEGLCGLEELTAEKNMIEDLSPLSGLHTLQKLDLSENRITDLSPLAGLDALQELDLSVPWEYSDDRLAYEYLCNDPVSLAPLSGLGKLNTLCLDGLALTDLSEIEELASLTVLKARDMPVLDKGSGVFPKNLEELDLTGTKLSVTENLGKLTKLKKLAMGRADDFAFLQNLTGLTELYPAKNAAKIPSQFAGLTNLTAFDANCFDESSCDLAEVCAVLSGMKELRVLHTPWSYLQAVPDLQKLEEVHTSPRGYFVEDGYKEADAMLLAELAKLPQLRVLGLEGGNLSLDFSLLAGSPLEMLSIEDSSRIENIAPLAQLTGLKELNFKNTGLEGTDISVLSSLPALKKLALTQCDLEALPEFPKENSPLEELLLDENPIGKLPDLSAFPQLRKLSLQETDVSDITGLAGLTQLEELQLIPSSAAVVENIEFFDLMPLAGLTKLQKLEISPCQDLSFLSGLTDLRELMLDCGTSKPSLAPLADLTKLETLALYHCETDSPLPDLSRLENLRTLELIFMNGNAFSNLSGISGLPALEELVMMTGGGLYKEEAYDEAGNLTTTLDLPAVSTLPKLKKLSFDYVRVADYAPLASLGRLREIEAYECELPEQKVFTGPASLRRLSGLSAPPQDMAALTGLRSASITITPAECTSCEPINALPNLTELELNVFMSSMEGTLNSESIKKVKVNGTIQDLNFLSGLPKVEELDVSDTAVGDLSAFSGLTSLKVLKANAFERRKPADMPQDENGVPYPKIRDLSPLSGLSELAELDLAYNQISDLSPLKNLGKLRLLCVDGNSITNLSSLAPMSGLRVLSAQSGVGEGNPNNAYVNNISGFEGMTGLCCLDLGWNQISDVSALGTLTRLRSLKLYPEYNFAGVADPTPLLGLGRIEAGGFQTTDAEKGEQVEKSTGLSSIRKW